MDVNILGTRYKILLDVEEKEMPEGADGCTDHSTKRIKIAKMITDRDSLQNMHEYKKQVLRHEIIHAFMFESGLGANWEHSNMGHCETTVDWFAVQFPKIAKVFAEVGCA